MKDRAVVYEEHQPWGTWVAVLMVVGLGGAALGVLTGGGDDMTGVERILYASGIVAFGLAVWGLLGGLTVKLTREAVHVGLGRGWPFRKRVLYSDIESVESVTYRPLREFGGWGVRGFGEKQAWTGRGNEAVVLRLENGKKLYVGSDNPRKLEERIRVVGGVGRAG